MTQGSWTGIEISEGLIFILRHLEEPHWPRTVSTKAQENAQTKVDTIEEALARYKSANFLDCKINAYPFREDWAYDLLGQAPYFIFIDLDLEHFPSMLALNRALNRTLKNIKAAFKDDKLEPTVLWSGNGYHIYLPIQAIVLETESVFADLVKGSQCSRMFLQFAEQFLSDKKADQCHTKGLSFKNCMIRIPGTINSKNNETVRIVQEWNGVRPAINWILRDFRRYLIQQKISMVADERRRDRYSDATDAPTKRQWIETLLNIPIPDYRKNALRLIVAPYLINIKKLSYAHAFNIAKKWLDLCSEKRPLDFNLDAKIKESLKAAARVGYFPIALGNLEEENPELYNLVYLYH
ncbi:DNA primase noncatalytic subunit PriX [Nitrososphaera sp. AFS]|uniref:DNA primase noncatalytic subunit PriX n=1 Tax=Nitrososphaera sp. AFS TaxID=2301191 RepID=UPI0013922618|nr:DNA primase noncatalytic subunit PriX [Nitrososphaera sp. AFS]NAL78053.1 DNA primase noncatalytic subunit PriX [Nitrososphaera sp. AFS]